MPLEKIGSYDLLFILQKNQEREEGVDDWA